MSPVTELMSLGTSLHKNTLAGYLGLWIQIIEMTQNLVNFLHELSLMMQHDSKGVIKEVNLRGSDETIFLVMKFH